MKFSLLVLAACLAATSNAINWQPGDWAMDCDFVGNDLISRRVPGDQCTNTCKSTAGCTHFTWTRWDGGTCWMKKGAVSKSQARSKSGAVCGIVSGGSTGTVTGCAGGNGGGLGAGNGCETGSALNKGALIWSDEFNYSGAPDSSKWYQVNAGGGFGNNEKQFYRNSGNNMVSNGNLVITTKKEYYGGERYTSGKIESHRKFTHGVFEMRAKLPKGRGIWPAFWLLAGPSWPRDGEIDIMENVGFEGNQVHATIHCGAHNHLQGTQVGSGTNVNDPHNTFHTYAVDWTANYIRGFVDGVQYFSYDKTSSSYDAWPFDNQFKIILNSAVGGNWGGQQGIDDGIFPTHYTIDYVRVYANGN